MSSFLLSERTNCLAWMILLPTESPTFTEDLSATVKGIAKDALILTKVME
jgi:hypothetical protein